MPVIPFVTTFVVLGLVLANVAVWVAWNARLAPWLRAAQFIVLFGLWLGVRALHELGAPSLAMPGQAMSVALAMFVVFGFPAFIARQLQAKLR
jgi:hypothetical protein